MPSESDLLGLIGLVYDSTENPALWTEFLERSAAVFGADLAVFQLQCPSIRVFEMISAYTHQNVWDSRTPFHYLEGRVDLDERMRPRADVVASQFCNDYLAPAGAIHPTHETIGGQRMDALMLAAIRGRQRSPFGETERRGLQVLLPHVTRAKAVGARLQMLKASTSVLDALDIAIVFMTSSGGHLRRIFDKTQTCRQTELMMVLGRLPRD